MPYYPPANTANSFFAATTPPPTTGWTITQPSNTAILDFESNGVVFQHPSAATQDFPAIYPRAMRTLNQSLTYEFGFRIFPNDNDNQVCGICIEDASGNFLVLRRSVGAPQGLQFDKYTAANALQAYGNPSVSIYAPDPCFIKVTFSGGLATFALSLDGNRWIDIFTEFGDLEFTWTKIGVLAYSQAGPTLGGDAQIFLFHYLAE